MRLANRFRAIELRPRGGLPSESLPERWELDKRRWRGTCIGPTGLGLSEPEPKLAAVALRGTCGTGRHRPVRGGSSRVISDVPGGRHAT